MQAYTDDSLHQNHRTKEAGADIHNVKDINGQKICGIIRNGRNEGKGLIWNVSQISCSFDRLLAHFINLLGERQWINICVCSILGDKQKILGKLILLLKCSKDSSTLFLESGCDSSEIYISRLFSERKVY